MSLTKVLIVDDEINLLESLGDTLKGKGFFVGTARNGLEALEKFKEHFFDIAIVDLKMPKMGGIELLEVIKERYPQTMVIILTGYGTIGSAVTAMKKGAYDYLIKPCMPDEVLRIVARAIHYKSPRRKKLFVKVSCAVLAEGVLESELFGHERGAFTDAYLQRRGRFELADGGTLFLDEIGDIPLGVQVKLLRVLQEGEFERVGGEETMRVDARIIAATNQDLSQAIKEKRFREDLFYRLNVVSLNLPSLKERKEDIPLLAEYFLNKFRAANKKVEGISKEALNALIFLEWPGNVRELENTMERAVVLAKGPLIEKEDLALFPSDISASKAGLSLPSRTLREVEIYLLNTVLEDTSWNLKKTAEILQISRTTLYSKIKRYGLKKAE